MAALLANSAFAQGLPTVPPSALALANHAQDLYQRGREHFFAGNFTAALEEFQQSLNAVDSPNTRLYVGRTLHRLERLPEAWAMLDRTARDAEVRAAQEPRYAATASAARAEADALRSQIGLLVVRVEPLPDNATITLNGHPLASAALGVTMPLDAGEVAVLVQAPGYAPALQIVSLGRGASEVCTIAMSPQSSDPSLDLVVPPGGVSLSLAERESARHRTQMWRDAGIVTMVVGGASLAGGVALYALARREYDFLRDRPMLAQDERVLRADRGDLFQTSGFLLMGVGAALGITGSVLRWRLGREVGEAPSAPRPSVTVEPTARGVVVSGSF